MQPKQTGIVFLAAGALMLVAGSGLYYSGLDAEKSTGCWGFVCTDPLASSDGAALSFGATFIGLGSTALVVGTVVLIVAWRMEINEARRDPSPRQGH